MSYLEDPRVFFASERTGLAWLRTSITIMGFGFVIEKFGIFIRYIKPDEPAINLRLSLVIGVLFIFLGSIMSFLAASENKKFLKSLGKCELPGSYMITLAVIANNVVALLGIFLIIYIFIANKP